MPTKTAKAPKGFRWSVMHAAAEFNIDRGLLAKKLKAAGIAPGGDDKFSTKEIVSVVFNSLRIQQIRKLRALADAAERKNEEAGHELVKTSDALMFLAAIEKGLRKAIAASKLPKADQADINKELDHAFNRERVLARICGDRD